MHPFPHRYVVEASASPHGDIPVRSAGLPEIASNGPAEFDGPGDRWSPETLMSAAVADCYILTFRALAKASHLEWRSIECRVEGVLDRVERVTQFVRFTNHVTLTIPATTDVSDAHALLEKAEQRCLVANSLRGISELVPTIETAA